MVGDIQTNAALDIYGTLELSGGGEVNGTGIKMKKFSKISPGNRERNNRRGEKGGDTNEMN
jgi:hypothetical protein